MTNRVRDKREPRHFWADNELVDEHLPAIGLHGFAVYMLLARWADNHTGQCDPSVGTIAGRLDISKPTVIRALRTLVEHGLITITERPRLVDGRKVNGTNVYTLLALKGGSKPRLLPNEVDQVVNDVDGGSQPGLPGVVNDVDTKKTDMKKTEGAARKRAAAQQEDMQADPVSIYRRICKVNPNDVQRKHISDKVQDFDAWRATCDEFATNGWNVRHIGNLLDNYQQRIKVKTKSAPRLSTDAAPVDPNRPRRSRAEVAAEARALAERAARGEL